MATALNDGSKDWRKNNTSLTDQLWYMYEYQLCTNMEIRVMSGQKHRVFSCHQALIARLSPKFEKEIMDCRDDEDGDCFINVKNLDPDYFTSVLKFAYTDKLTLNSMKEALALWHWSQEYKADRLKQMSEQFISTRVDQHTVWEILSSGVKGTQALTWAKSFLGKSTSQCLRSPKFLDITAATLLEVLKMNLLNVDSELEIVKAVLRWLQYREPEKLEPTRAQQLLGPCLQHIRFLALPATEFSMHVTKSGLLHNDECLSLLVNLASPGEMPIPHGICTIRTQRQKPSHAEKTSEPKKPLEKEKSPTKKLEKPVEKEKSPTKKLASEVTTKKPAKELVIKRTLNNNKIHKLHTPIDHHIPFKVDKPVFLNGLIFNTRTNNNNQSSITYMESIHICVNKEKQRIAYQSFHGMVPYGPNESFQVNFKTPGKLQPNTWYELKLIYPSEGYYRNPWMKDEFNSHGVTFTFAGAGDDDEDEKWSPSAIVGIVIKM